MEVVHKSQYFLVKKIIATVSLIVWFLINMNQTFIYFYTHSDCFKLKCFSVWLEWWRECSPAGSGDLSTPGPGAREGRSGSPTTPPCPPAVSTLPSVVRCLVYCSGCLEAYLNFLSKNLTEILFDMKSLLCYYIIN